ncbi:MAG: HAMP domain-containing sensor histidine kinase, partial [Bacteroidota bacterium]
GQEQQKVQLWVDATDLYTQAPINTTAPFIDKSIAFIFRVIDENKNIPVLLVDEEERIISYRNLDIPDGQDSAAYLQEQLVLMKARHEPLKINYFGTLNQYVYFKESKLFEELKVTFEDIQQSFISELLINSASTPVILTDSTRSVVLEFDNVDSSRIATPELLAATLVEMEGQNLPIAIELSEGVKSYIFYEDSFLLTQLKYYPLAQFGVIGLFILIAYLLFSTARRVEQNQVWVGMSKETAHQLGTPLSSLIAWMELLKSKDLDPSVLAEMNKDVHRLEVITDRFSKIGSIPKLEPHSVSDVLEHALNYIRSRSSGKVTLTLGAIDPELTAQMNIPLFEWVVENLCKNAIDAMSGQGTITVEAERKGNVVHIEVTDTVKGIPPSKQKTVFQPGYTTKKRGWGLGLSLVKRIIENYHNGKIFVKKSEVGKGTTFRIILQHTAD